MKVVLNFEDSTMILCFGMTTNIYHIISLASHTYFSRIRLNARRRKGGGEGKIRIYGESGHVFVCTRNAISAFPVM